VSDRTLGGPEFARITRLRGRLGFIAALLCALGLLGAIDGLQARILTPRDFHRLLPGQALEVSGPLPARMASSQLLHTRSGEPGLKLSIDAVQREFWFGTPMWRGTLSAQPDVPPGDYVIRIDGPVEGLEQQVGRQTVRIVPDPRAWRRSDPAGAVRLFGFSPWSISLALLPFIGLSVGGVFLLSRRRDALLAQLELAELYRVLDVEGECRLWFGLGAGAGIQVGDLLEVLDPGGVPLGQARVLEVTLKASMAGGYQGRPAHPGCLIRPLRP